MYVLMSGLPGSGKTSVATPLARVLGWPRLSKDEIKESLWDTLGPGDREWSTRLGGAAQEVLQLVAASVPDAVLDTFMHREWRERWRALPGPIAEVYCHCPPEIVRERMAARRRHACHFDAEHLAEKFDRWVREDARPLDLGGPVLELDTTGPIDAAAIATVAAWVRRADGLTPDASLSPK